MVALLSEFLTDWEALGEAIFHRSSPLFLDGLTYLILFGALIWILFRRVSPERGWCLPASIGALILSTLLVWAELRYGFRLGSIGPAVSGLVALALLVVLGGVVLFLRKRAKALP